VILPEPHAVLTIHHEATQAANRRGIVAMVAAMAMFVANDVLVKLAAGHFPVGQLMAIRGVFACLFALGVVIAFKETTSLNLLMRPIVILRGALEGAIALMFITALKHLPIGNVTAILMAASLIVIMLAVALGLEKVGWRRWAAVLVGFIGVLIMVRPSGDGFTWYSLLALGSATLVAVRELVTKRLGLDIPSSVVALATTIATGTIGFLFSLTSTWRPIMVAEVFYLIVAAAFVAGGNLAIIMAYRGTDVSVVSGYRYCIVVLAMVLGFVIWGDVPDIWSLAGSLLIVGSGLYTLHRQRVRASEKSEVQSQP
jgi:drug/metabolite transporter (DMT)-like permease